MAIRRFDRLHQPVELMDWCGKMENLEYSILASTAVGAFQVVTRWHGTDVNSDLRVELGWGLDLPMLWETLVWPRGPMSILERMFGVERFLWPSEPAALAGHAEGVQWAFDRSAASGLVPMLVAP